MSRDLGSLTWTELAARERPVRLLVPVGSIEQHGPHLPLDTDCVIAMALAQAAAEQRPDDSLVGPMVALSSAGEHQGFPGTLSIGQVATVDTLIELGRSAIVEDVPWCSGLVFVVGHGGAAESVARAVARLRAESRPCECWFPTDPDGDAHAGRTETSVMMALAPESLRRSAAEPGYVESLGWVREELVTSGLKAVTDNGVLGDPTTADLDYGRALIRRWADEVVERIDRLPSG